MKLKEKISKDYMSAFKAKDTNTKNVLSVIKGEIQTLEKNKNIDCLSDDEVLKIITKTGKSIRETLSFTKNESDISELTSQLSVVDSYLPKLMSEDEIIIKINEVINTGDKSMGAIMKAFVGLSVDRKMISTLANKML